MTKEENTIDLSGYDDDLDEEEDEEKDYER